jgi:tight adherence protein B
MVILAVVFLIVFGTVFYLTKSYYSDVEGRAKVWEKKKIDEMSPKIDKMFIDISFRRLLILDVLTPIVTGSLGYAFSKNLWVAGGAAAVGLVIPIIVIKEMEKARRRKFSSQIVDALMILSGCLKAGLSLPQSFEVLIEEMPAPISQEFGLLLRQIRMGVSLENSLIGLKKRMRVDDLDMVITAMMVARETGGDLTETFSRLAFTIQERNKLIGKVNALCVQGKLQGIIMSIIPIAFAAFVYKTNPHFFDVFFQDAFGKGLLTYAIISQILGMFFIRKLSRVDI